MQYDPNGEYGQKWPPVPEQNNPAFGQPAPVSQQPIFPGQPQFPTPGQPDVPFGQQAFSPSGQPGLPAGQQAFTPLPNQQTGQQWPPMQEPFGQQPTPFQGQASIPFGQPVIDPSFQQNVPWQQVATPSGHINVPYGQPMAPMQQARENSSINSFNESWWIGIPKALRSHSLMLSEAWADGQYLTARPLAGFMLPLWALLFGLAEGATHFDVLINSSISQGQIAVAFTELLPFMSLTALAAAMSANLGLMMLLGYALGDFFIFGLLLNRQQLVAPSDNLLLTLTYPYVPRLISYAIFFSLAVMATISTTYLTANLKNLLNRFLKNQEPTTTILRALLEATVLGVIVFVWTQAAPLLIRVFWGWTNVRPPLAAAADLLVYGGVVVFFAIVGSVLRNWISYSVRNSPAVVGGSQRLAAAFKEADAHPSSLRTLPPEVRAILAALGITLLTSGFIASLLEGVIIFVLLAAMLVVRIAVLPRLEFWGMWARLVGRVPLIARIAGGGVLAYVLVQALITTYESLFPESGAQTASASLRPVLIGLCVSLVIMTILLPRVSLSSSSPKSRPGPSQLPMNFQPGQPTMPPVYQPMQAQPPYTMQPGPMQTGQIPSPYPQAYPPPGSMQSPMGAQPPANTPPGSFQQPYSGF